MADVGVGLEMFVIRSFVDAALENDIETAFKNLMSCFQSLSDYNNRLSVFAVFIFFYVS